MGVPTVIVSLSKQQPGLAPSKRRCCRSEMTLEEFDRRVVDLACHPCTNDKRTIGESVGNRMQLPGEQVVVLGHLDQGAVDPVGQIRRRRRRHHPPLGKTGCRQIRGDRTLGAHRVVKRPDRLGLTSQGDSERSEVVIQDDPVSNDRAGPGLDEVRQQIVICRVPRPESVDVGPAGQLDVAARRLERQQGCTDRCRSLMPAMKLERT